MSRVPPWAERAAQRDAMILAALADGWWERAIGPWINFPPSGCWLWTRALSKGYGAVGIPLGLVGSGGRMAAVHRVAYLRAYGAIPYGMTLDHTCRTRACCNPSHLEPVTNRANILRGDGVSALAASKTHCPEGHPLDGPDADLATNPVHADRGWRSCRVCSVANSHRTQRLVREARRLLGISHSDYVSTYGQSHSVALDIIDSRGGSLDGALPRPRVKLTEDQVRLIRADPRRPAAIAREYGISPTNVSHIRHGRTWRHVA